MTAEPSQRQKLARRFADLLGVETVERMKHGAGHRKRYYLVNRGDIHVKVESVHYVVVNGTVYRDPERAAARLATLNAGRPADA